MLAPFLDCLHEFDPKKTHIMLALMIEPRFKDIVSNYVGRDMATITITRYDSKILIIGK